MKKFLSLLLSLCLMASLATEAFAVGGSGTTDVVFESDVAAPDVFNVIVPAEIPIYMSKAGDLQISNTLAIENKSGKAVEVKSIRVDGKNGWSVLDYASDFSGKPADTKDLALSFRGDATDGTGNIKPSAGNWVIDKDNSLNINTAAKVPLQTQASRTSIATVVWTINWAEPGAEQPEEPGKDITIQVLPGDHGAASVTEICPGADGRVDEYPEVSANTGYDFKNWVDAENLSLVDDSTVYEKDSSIRPVFELKSGWTSVPVNPVPGVTVKPEKDPEVLIDPDGVVQVVPDIKPDEGYTGGNLTDQDGNEVKPGTVINNTINITIIINVTVDGGDKPENPDAGKYPVEIPVNDGEHGKADADKITTDDEGRIPGFPGVTPDEGYIHDGWEDQNGNPVDETTKLNPGDEITPVFRADPDYKPDTTVKVQVLPGENGSCSVTEITTNSERKIPVYPDVTSSDNYVFDKWVDRNGDPVDENTVYEDGDAIRPVFKPIEYVDFIVTQTNRDMVGYMGTAGESLDIPSVFTGDDGVHYRVVGIRWNAFYGTGLASVSIPEGCRYVESGAFKNCNSLTDVSFPSTLDYISNQAFEYTALTDVTIPASVTLIDGMAFRHIPTLRSVTFESGSALETLGGYAFANTGLTSFVIPDGVTAIPNDLFYQCGSLKSVTIPSSVTEIGIGAFGGCLVLSLTVPNSVTTILEDAFLGIGSVTYHGSASGRPWGASRVN